MLQPLGTPKVRDAEATKARLLQAATDEFAAHGIAGARIDRIEAAARANRALIYSYFGNKDQLFDAVMDANVARVLDQVPFTPEDLLEARRSAVVEAVRRLTTPTRRRGVTQAERRTTPSA